MHQRLQVEVGIVGQAFIQRRYSGTPVIPFGQFEILPKFRLIGEGVIKADAWSQDHLWEHQAESVKKLPQVLVISGVDKIKKNRVFQIEKFPAVEVSPFCSIAE
jgi:hypothetical protein